MALCRLLIAKGVISFEEYESEAERAIETVIRTGVLAFHKAVNANVMSSDDDVAAEAQQAVESFVEAYLRTGVVGPRFEGEDGE